MKANMGNIDRLIRFIAAGVIVVLYFNGNISGTLSYILLAVAAIFLLTSIAGVCPLYSVFGINTCSAGKAGRQKESAGK